MPEARSATGTSATGTSGNGTSGNGTSTTGTLITVAPAAGPIGHLLRTAIDAEQVGATRLHLAADQPDLTTAVSALREQTRLILTGAAGVPGVDEIGTAFTDVLIEENLDLPGLVIQVAGIVASHPVGVSICGAGSSALPVLLAALASGGHLSVISSARDQAALVARASGLARIAGRPPLHQVAARELLGL